MWYRSLALAILMLFCSQTAESSCNINVGGRASTVLQISLNGGPYAGSATDYFQFGSGLPNEKQSQLSIKANVSTWNLTAQASVLEATNVDPSSALSYINFQTFSTDGTVLQTLLPGATRLDQFMLAPTAIAAGSRPTGNAGTTMMVDYALNQQLPAGAQISGAIRYELRPRP